MAKYDVHIYAVVRVKVYGVEAESQQEATDVAFNKVSDDLYEMFPDQTPDDDAVIVVTDDDLGSVLGNRYWNEEKGREE